MRSVCTPWKQHSNAAGAFSGNGELVSTEESAGVDFFVTTDKNLRYQQNLIDRRLAIVVLWKTSWPELRLHANAIAAAARALTPGEYRDVSRPD